MPTSSGCERRWPLSWREEFEILQALGMHDGMELLEAGSGPGFVSKQLLKAFPGARLTAVELDPAMNIRAARLLRGCLERTSIVQASILNTGLEDDAYDFAVARYLFQHLAAPDFAAVEIFRVLKPGGTIAIIDADDAVGGVVDPAFSGSERGRRQS